MKPTVAWHRDECEPAGEILAQIGGKWTMLIIDRLGQGQLRFGELKRDIGDISQKVLTSTLRNLEMDGFVSRTVTPTIPPRVDYQLTELGRELLVPVRAVGAWAIENRQRVLEARARFTARNEQLPAGQTRRIGGAAL